MPVAASGRSSSTTSAAATARRCWLIMGMSGTALHWGEPFLERAARELRGDRLRPPRRRRQQPPGGPITIAEMAEDAAGLLRALELDSRARARHLDGRDGRPGARARPARARAHADARLHLLRRPGQHARLRSCGRAAARGDAAPATASGRCARRGRPTSRRRRPPTPSYARAFSAIAARARRRGAGDHGPGRRDAPRTTRSARLARADDADARDPRHRRRVLPVENGRLIASLIPGSRLEIFDGVGHLFFWERPDRSAELLRAHAAVPA